MHHRRSAGSGKHNRTMDGNQRLEMKTILHVIDTTGPGGAETVFIELADRLRERGFRSIPLIRGPGWVQNALNSRGLTPVVLEAKGSFNLGFLFQLVRLIRRERVDLIQSHLLGSNVYCALAGWLTGTPVVATFHGMVDISPGERLRGFKLWVMERGVRRFVAVSKSLAEAVAEKELIDAARTSIIYNGINVRRYNRSPAGLLHEQLGLPAAAVLAVSVGNVRPAKAYDVLIDAAARLTERHPDLHFVVAGHIKQSLMQQLEARMSARGVADRMHFIGFVDDTPAILSDADLFVLSSSSEGFSISTIEALASGLPAVVTRCGGPEEIVTPGEDALMVPPGDPAALAEGIDQILSQPDLRQSLAANGRNTARNRFDIQTMLDQYQAVYRRALKAR